MPSDRTPPNVSRRQFLRAGLAGAGAIGLGGLLGAYAPLLAADALRRMPNVVFMLIDDQLKSEMKAYGGNVLTPNMDRICNEGIRFTRGYTSSPTCTPTRYTCITGEYASRCTHPFFMEQSPPGQTSYVTWNTHFVPTRSMAHAFKDVGYVTGMVGKWHLSPNDDAHLEPIDRDADAHDPAVAAAMSRNHKRASDYIKSGGFDSAEAIYWSNVSNQSTPGCPYHNQEWLTQAGLDFIEKHKDEPFFLYWSTSLLHSPFRNSIEADPRLTAAGWLDEAPRPQAPRETITPRLEAAGINPNRNNVRHVLWLDDAVGALLDKLDALKLQRDTLVVYFSDQERLGKGVLYEMGACTPMMMRWPGTILAGQVTGALAGNVDIVATFFDVCGAKPRPGWTMDGVSLMPLVTKQVEQVNDALFLEMGYTRSVVTPRYKYIALRYPEDVAKAIEEGTRPRYHMFRNVLLQRRAAETYPAYGDADQLYDLENDPNEQKNLAADPAHAETLKAMKAKLTEFLKTFPNRPFGEFV